MVKGRRGNSRKYRKRYRRRFKKYARNSWQVRSNSFCPPSIVVPMNYYNDIAMQGVAGSPGYATFTANDIHDPNTALGGHQPMGRDQWYTLYNKAIVLGSKIEAHLWQQEEIDNTERFILGIDLDDDASPHTTVSNALESKRFPHRVVNMNQASDRDVVVYRAFSAKKFFHIRNPIDEEELKQDISGTLGRKAYFHVMALPTSSTTTPTLTGYVLMKFMVLFCEPKQLAQS